MTAKLPASAEIAEYYNQVIHDSGGDYIRHRWTDSKIKRNHYRQTERALRNALDKVESLGNVLEIGSGPAVWTPLILRRASQIQLLDISTGMLEMARQRIAKFDSGTHAAKVSYVCGDFVSKPIDRRRFDSIVTIRAFEYMTGKTAALRKCYRLLKEGGKLLLVTKNKGWRDERRKLNRSGNTSSERMSVQAAMQNDLQGWRQLTNELRSVGFNEVSSFPVVLGSYYAPFQSRGGLIISDLLHRCFYRRSMIRLLDRLTESYLITATKPKLNVSS